MHLQFEAEVEPLLVKLQKFPIHVIPSLVQCMTQFSDQLLRYLREYQRCSRGRF